MNLNWKKTIVEDAKLDRELGSRNQTEMARLVKSLPDEIPSMTWRSELNEKLLKQAARLRRKKLLTNWVFRPALGLGLASLATVLMFTSPQSGIRNDKSAEVADAIVRTYTDDVQNREVIYTPGSLEPTQPVQQTDSTADPYAEDVTDSI